MNFAHHVSNDHLLLRGQVESPHKPDGCFNGLFAEFVNIQLCGAANRHSQNLRFKPCAATCFAPLAGHKCADAIARELALGLFIEPLHLGHESFKWLGNCFFDLVAGIHFNWLAVRAEVKRRFEFLGQVSIRHVFVQMEMFHERALQMTIVGPHPFGATSPWCDCAFGQSFGGIGDH